MNEVPNTSNVSHEIGTDCDGNLDEQNMNDLDSAMNDPDHVKVAVDVHEDVEFAMDEESDSEETSHSLVDMDDDPVVSFNRRGSNELAQPSTSKGFDYLKANPAFQTYVKDLVAKELQDHRIVKHRTLEKSKGNGNGMLNNNANRQIK